MARLPVGVVRRGSFYQARWYDAAGRRHSASFDTAAEADAYRQDRLRARRRGGSGDPTGGQITLAEWWTRWMAGRQIRPSTRARDIAYARTWLLPDLGDRRLCDLRPSDVSAWLARLTASGLAPRTVREHRSALASLLRAAVVEGLLDTNPAAGVKAPAVPHVEARFLTPDELVRLEAATERWWGLVVPFLADTGLRLGELAGLRVEDVDVLRGRVRVVRTVSSVTKAVSGAPAHRQLHEPKTAAGRRVVPTLTRTTGEQVAAMIGERELRPEDWLFSGKRGAPMDPAVWRARVWRPAVREAELADPLPTPHALRHTAVALWIAAGVTEPLKLARWAGHSSIAVTYGTYGHLLPDDADPTRDALERIRASAARPSEGQIRRLGS